MKYFKNIFGGASRLLNAMLGGNPDESLSARCHRTRGIGRKIINKIFFWQNDHCSGAWSDDAHDAISLLEQEHERLDIFQRARVRMLLKQHEEEGDTEVYTNVT